MKTKYLLMIIICITFVSCQKLIEVPAPVNTINQENVYTTDATATAVLNSVYAKLSSSSLIFAPSIHGFTTAFLGVSSDELTYYAPNNGAALSFYYKNALLSSIGGDIFSGSYSLIYVLNDAIENLQTANKLTPAVRSKLLGEAYFLRAYYYFNLVNIYGDLPLVLTTDYKVNSVISKTAQSEVYNQIKNDLLQAKPLLAKQYMATNAVTVMADRTVPNYYAATALLARVYLYQKEYANAEAESSEVISQNSLYSLPALSNAFLRTSQEALFQLQPVNNGWNTEDGKFYIPSGGFSTNHPVYLSTYLLNAFEAGDQRRIQWVGKYTEAGVDYYYPYKYKIGIQSSSVTEYSVVLRLAEQYLIRAEARAMLDRIGEAQSDLNKVRNRAGLGNTTADAQGTLITAILHERQVELFSEQGHRWLDLKRTGLLDATMGAPGNVAAAKGGSWSSFRQLFPFPQSELTANPKLTQNPGY